MASPLEALAARGDLVPATLAPAQSRALVDRAAALLADARRTSLSLPGRACLAREAALALAAAALGAHGYRAASDPVALACLEHTLATPGELAVLRQLAGEPGEESIEDATRVAQHLVERLG